VKGFLQDLPRSWDETRFVDGYPGRHVVIARRAGQTWYVAGLNADSTEKPLELDLSFIGKGKGTLITDGEGERAFTQSPLKGGKHRISIKAHGGFVAVFQ
jgi:hypothetical protein